MNNLQADLDEIDHELLRLLTQNSRMTNADLAAAVGIAQSTCITRVRSLVSRGVISGFTANVDPAAVGLSSQVLISVTLRAGARSHLADFMKEMRNLPEVIQVFFLGGSEDDLRGYRYMTVSPLDELEKPLGAVMTRFDARLLALTV